MPWQIIVGCSLQVFTLTFDPFVLRSPKSLEGVPSIRGQLVQRLPSLPITITTSLQGLCCRVILPLSRLRKLWGEEDCYWSLTSEDRHNRIK